MYVLFKKNLSVASLTFGVTSIIHLEIFNIFSTIFFFSV